MSYGNTNLVTTIIGFGLSATFIVFVCTRIICGRLRESLRSRTIYEIQSRTDIELRKHMMQNFKYLVTIFNQMKKWWTCFHGDDSAPAFVAAIPTLNFNHEIFSSTETTQCVICLAEYKEKELLRIIPKCGHTFHLSCIDMWLRKQSTCPVCRLPLQNTSETKHVRHVTFTIRHSLDEPNSNASERNTDSEREVELNSTTFQQSALGKSVRQDELNSSNPQQSTLGESAATQ